MAVQRCGDVNLNTRMRGSYGIDEARQVSFEVKSERQKVWDHEDAAYSNANQDIYGSSKIG